MQQDGVCAEVIGQDVRNDHDGGAGADHLILEELGRDALDGFLDVGGEGQFDGAHATGEGELAADALLRGDRIEPGGAGAEHRHLIGEHAAPGEHDDAGVRQRIGQCDRGAGDFRALVAKQQGVKFEAVSLGAGSGEILENAVQAFTSANLSRRAVVRSPGSSGMDIAGPSATTGPVDPTAGLTGITDSISAAVSGPSPYGSSGRRSAT